ncbi:EAL domain-containing protein [Streptomyces sp. NPDC005438]|uniref:EAL domain-containing protein n=1 Tax=Streptomyces sp. NPDC005438 TaxID=3156880 RepID=UPI0033A54461
MTKTAPAFPPLLLAAICAGYAAGAALGWGTLPVALLVSELAPGLAALTAAASCLCYARTDRAGSQRPAWLLLGWSSILVGLGQALWGAGELLQGAPTARPPLVDLCLLASVPPAVVGMLILAKRPTSRAGWLCLGLDALLIVGSLASLTWSLARAHAGGWNGDSVVPAALTLAYPLLQVLLVAVVLGLTFRRSPERRPAMGLALATLALSVLCDALLTSPLLRERYHTGQLLDAGWLAASLLLAYAPWAAADDRRTGTVDAAGGEESPEGAAQVRPVTGFLSALTPYLAAAVCSLGVLRDVWSGRPADPVVLAVGGVVVFTLVVRQGVMLLDNITLAQELAQKENHFRSLVQGSSDVIMIAASTGVLRYVSPAATGVYGTRADDLVGTELASLIHPEDLGRVFHEIRRFLAASPQEEPSTRIECRFRRGSGGWLNVESTINRYRGGLIFNSRDVTERVRLQAQLQHNASHDPLTDLPNRALFTERVGQALTGRRGGDGEAAVLYIDLDGFKAVNDTAGHQAGDELLIQAARRLRESVRAGDTAARLGGDEFAALIQGDGNREGPDRDRRIREIADRLRVRLSEPYQVDGAELRVAASIGVAFAEPGITPAALMRHADVAMYRAKESGKGCVKLYSAQLRQEPAPTRTLLMPALQRVLGDGELALLHQPVVELATGRVTHLVAQARWRTPQGYLFTPTELFRGDGRPAEGGHPDHAARVGRWLLEEAVEQAAERYRKGLRVPVAVRISARRITDRTLSLAGVEKLLKRHRLPAGALMLELSDSDPRIPLEELEVRLSALCRMGVSVSLDAFGSGYAAIAALRRLPIDVLRLDRGLVDGIVESGRLHKITSGLLKISTDLGLSSIADGVDHPEQVATLRAMGCTHGQGVAFAGPLEKEALLEALERGVYPVPSAERAPRSQPVTVPASGSPVPAPAPGPSPFRRRRLPGGGPATSELPRQRPHNETPIPPT